MDQQRAHSSLPFPLRSHSYIPWNISPLKESIPAAYKLKLIIQFTKISLTIKIISASLKPSLPVHFSILVPKCKYEKVKTKTLKKVRIDKKQKRKAKQNPDLLPISNLLNSPAKKEFHLLVQIFFPSFRFISLN